MCALSVTSQYVTKNIIEASNFIPGQHFTDCLDNLTRNFTQMSLYLSDNEIRQNTSIGICENLRYVSITFNLSNHQSIYLTSDKK